MFSSERQYIRCGGNWRPESLLFEGEGGDRDLANRTRPFSLMMNVTVWTIQTLRPRRRICQRACQRSKRVSMNVTIMLRSEMQHMHDNLVERMADGETRLLQAFYTFAQTSQQ